MTSYVLIEVGLFGDETAVFQPWRVARVFDDSLIAPDGVADDGEGEAEKDLAAPVEAADRAPILVRRQQQCVAWQPHGC